jgi:hypothetical protein
MDKPERHWWDKVKPFVEIIGVALLAIYTGYTIKMYSANRDAADAAQSAVANAKEQFRQDARPYVWVTNNGLGQPEFIFDRTLTGAPMNTGQILWTFHYTDYGKTPAYNLSSERLFSVGVNSPFRESHGFSQVEKVKGTPVPPNKDDFQTVVSDPGITAEQYKQFLRTDNALRIRAVIQYSDAYGEKYETGLCLGRLASGAIQYCDGSYIAAGSLERSSVEKAGNRRYLWDARPIDLWMLVIEALVLLLIFLEFGRGVWVGRSTRARDSVDRKVMACFDSLDRGAEKSAKEISDETNISQGEVDASLHRLSEKRLVECEKGQWRKIILYATR